MLSIFNAAYSGVLCLVLVYDLFYLDQHQLLRDFAQGEVFSDDFGLLLEWFDTYSLVVFAVRQLGWASMYWHGYIAYMFLVTTGQKRPVSALQRALPLVLCMVAVVVILSVLLETLSFLHILKINPMWIEVVFSGSCLAFVVCAYVGTCYALISRKWDTASGREAPRTFQHVRTRTIIKLLTVVGAFIMVYSWVLTNTIQVES